MASRFKVPIQEDVRDILTDLFGRGVAVDKTDQLGSDTTGLVAQYVTADDEVGVVCVFDVPFSVFSSAALMMQPPLVAKEDSEAGEVSDATAEIAHEVANVLSRLLNSESTPHLRLTGLHRSPGSVPDDVAAVLGAPATRRDYVAAIEGYGEGRLAILAA